MRRPFSRALILSLVLGAGLAQGYPETIRHGYASCTSCHVSPTGGGTLTEYGRGLSEALFAASATEGEGAFLYGVVPLPSALRMGGDVRAIQTHRETPTRRQGRPVFMQADVEGAVELARWSALVSVGLEQGNEGGWGGTSRKHWVAYRATDEIALRVGRFQRNFLFNTAEHTTLVKRAAGLGPATETYNVEASAVSAAGEFFLTANLGRPDQTAQDRESGTSVKAALVLGGSFKLGLQYDFARSSQMSRHLVGPYLALGLGEKTALLVEAVLRRGANTGGAGETGLLTYGRLGREIFAGGWLYGQEEWGTSAFGKSAPAHLTSLGLQFFPRPHWEIHLMVQHRWATSDAPAEQLGVLQGHFYL